MANILLIWGLAVSGSDNLWSNCLSSSTDKFIRSLLTLMWVFQVDFSVGERHHQTLVWSVLVHFNTYSFNKYVSNTCCVKDSLISYCELLNGNSDLSVSLLDLVLVIHFPGPICFCENWKETLSESEILRIILWTSRILALQTDQGSYSGQPIDLFGISWFQLYLFLTH